MDLWYASAYSLSEIFSQISWWIETNRLQATLLAISIPVLLFSIRSIVRGRQRMRQLDQELLDSTSQHRLPPETLERDRLQEKRYRESLKEKSGKKTTKNEPSRWGKR